jgi:hypothetical protein
MKNLTEELMQSFVSDCKLNPKTVRNLIATLRIMWNSAKAWGMSRSIHSTASCLPEWNMPEQPSFTDVVIRKIAGDAKKEHRAMVIERTLVFEKFPNSHQTHRFCQELSRTYPPRAIDPYPFVLDSPQVFSCSREVVVKVTMAWNEYCHENELVELARRFGGDLVSQSTHRYWPSAHALRASCTADTPISGQQEDSKLDAVTQTTEAEVARFIPTRDDLLKLERYWAQNRDPDDDPELFAGFISTRYELLALAGHWADLVVNLQYFWFIKRWFGGSDIRRHDFALMRIGRIKELLGADVDKVVAEVLEERGKHANPRYWEIFLHGTPEQRKKVQEEIDELEERDSK